MGTSVSFAKGVRAEIAGTAAASRDEVCGLLLGSADRVDAALPCRNVASDPATAFEIDPAQLIAALRAERGGGPQVVGCYHSHPSGDATPSARDAAGATANGWVWVIVRGGEVRAFRAIEHGAIHGRFAPLFVSPATAGTHRPPVIPAEHAQAAVRNGSPLPRG